jgi:hypothetical protein
MSKLKISVILFIIFLMVFSCWLHRPSRSKIIFKENREYIITPDSIKWYHTSLEELERIPRSSELSYEGTFRNYHLIRWWTKILYYPDQCTEFSIMNTEFRPEYQYEYLMRDSIDWQYRSQRIFKEANIDN